MILRGPLILIVVVLQLVSVDLVTAQQYPFQNVIRSSDSMSAFRWTGFGGQNKHIPRIPRPPKFFKWSPPYRPEYVVSWVSSTPSPFVSSNQAPFRSSVPYNPLPLEQAVVKLRNENYELPPFSDGGNARKSSAAIPRNQITRNPISVHQSSPVSPPKAVSKLAALVTKNPKVSFLGKRKKLNVRQKLKEALESDQNGNRDQESNSFFFNSGFLKKPSYNFTKSALRNANRRTFRTSKFTQTRKPIPIKPSRIDVSLPLEDFGGLDKHAYLTPSKQITNFNYVPQKTRFENIDTVTKSMSAKKLWKSTPKQAKLRSAAKSHQIQRKRAKSAKIMQEDNVIFVDSGDLKDFDFDTDVSKLLLSNHRTESEPKDFVVSHQMSFLNAKSPPKRGFNNVKRSWKPKIEPVPIISPLAPPILPARLH